MAGLMTGKGGSRKKGNRKRSATTPQVDELLATIGKHILGDFDVASASLLICS